jgi:RND family efflux transporter MFP subunit
MRHPVIQQVESVKGASLLLLALLGGCGGRGEETPPERPPPLVEAVEARTGTLPLEETVNGFVKARNQTAVLPEIAAPIVEVMVQSGEAVERGQPLVRLRDDELREQLRQAEAGVRLAEAAAAEARARVAEVEARVSRTRTLAREELVSAQELEVQEAQLAALEASADTEAARVEQAEATAGERRSALAKTVVRAPLSGHVGQRRAEVGMRAEPSTVLFVIGDLDEVMVEVPLTESMLDRVDAGMTVSIEPRSAEDEPIRATLSRVSPFLAEESFTTVGEIDVDNRGGRLRPGMFVTVRILYGESRRATLVPASAVWEDPQSGDRGIFVVADPAGLESPAEATLGTPVEATPIAFRPVEVLAEGGGTMGVGNLDEGDWVVVVGQHMLHERARDEAGRRDGDAASGPATTALGRVRPTSWERIQGLQSLQREDLLAGFLDKQQKVAAALGAEIPESEDEVDRVLGKAAGATAAGGE